MKHLKLKPHILEKITPIIKELVREGVFAKADVQNGFCSNINAVSKPSPGKVHLGQGDSYLEKLKENSGNSQRICLDLRKVNECMAVILKSAFQVIKVLQGSLQTVSVRPLIFARCFLLYP